MSKLRSVSTAFWSDPFIEELNSDEKLLYLYLITNDKTNMLGIYEISMSRISFDTGIKKETVLNALKRFESLSKVKLVSNYIILCNFMKHQNFNTNMMKSAIDVYNGLPQVLKIQGITVSKENPSEGFESLSNGLGMVRKVEVEYEVELESQLEEEKPSSPPVFSFLNSLISLGVEDQTAKDWMKVRKERKATNTETALKAFLTSVEKSDKSVNEVVKICAENSWKGFNKDWLNNSQPNQKNNVPIFDSNR
jgi:hypothetical protein